MAGNRASCTRRQRLAKWPHAPVVARCSHGCNSAVVPPAIATLTQVRSDGRRSGGRRGAGLQGTTGAAGRKLPTAGTVDLEVPVHQSVLPTPYILRDEESTIRAHLRATGVPASRQAPTRFPSEGSTFAVAERSVLCRAIGISGTAPGTTCGNHRANYPRHLRAHSGMIFAVQMPCLDSAPHAGLGPDESASAVRIEPLPERLFDAAIQLWQDSGLTRPWNDPEADLRRAADGGSS